MNMKNQEKLASILAGLYGEETGRETLERLEHLVERRRLRLPAPRQMGVDQRDSILITYGDQVSEPGAAPLKTLADFCASRLAGVVSGIHFLPFFPYSSDDGFSVIDYTAVNPELGTWEDIERFRQGFRLMFDAVINHVSVRSDWFQSFLAGKPRYRETFITVPQGADLSQVVRPRTLPLLTNFTVAGQVQKVWTTFSPDQVDLNYHNPAVLLDILEVLLEYVERGAEFIRLDAIAYLWKESGTRCIHLPQTHQVIQLIRAMLDDAAPHVALITETNVSHSENLSYFGDGTNEAQMVYNFALPPLVLHTFHSSSAQALSQWASGLVLPSPRVTFFNFLASHDGIGLNPARGILSEAQIDALVAHARDHGGFVSYKNNPDGSTSPYELNINYFDALSDPHGSETPDLQAQRFLGSQAIMLSLAGVPGIYFHSLFGSHGWREGALQSGHNRTINRQKCSRDALEAELADPASLRYKVFRGYEQLLRVRAGDPAFDPYGEMTVLDAGAQVFALLRAGRVLCLQNVSLQPQAVSRSVLGSLGSGPGLLVDRISGHLYPGGEAVHLLPYQSLWLAKHELKT